jgi:lipoprotein-anchoring transpeptidase ErfK/SrfK
MSVSRPKIGGVLVAAAVSAALFAGSGAAIAQSPSSQGGLIEFLWGGEPEYGGQQRQVVSFNPQYKAGQIIVSFGDRRLYHITKAGQAMSYPIAVPREQSRWQGNTSVSQKRENPDWRPTPEMLRENPRLPSWVPGGHPMNPLGVRALYLGSSLYRIHGTDAPWTIGQDVSKGCIRMFNEDVKHLYPLVPTGTKVVVTWERFKTKGVEMADSESAAPAPAAKKKRVAGKAPKSGFFVVPAANAAEAGAEAATDTTALDSDEGLTQEDDATVFVRNADGTYSREGADTSSGEAPASEPKKVTRYNRRVGGTLSRAAEEQVN